MWFFKKTSQKEKTSLELVEEQLIFWRKVYERHAGTNNISERNEAYKKISQFEDHLITINKEQMPARLKALEDSYAELTLLRDK